MTVFPLLLASVWQYVFATLMLLTAVFLILLVLVQRGRGGGLAGAFGGMGGQSAFGSKAGDLFTRITMGAAAFWIVLCILSIAVLNRQETLYPTGAPSESLFESSGETDPTEPAGSGETPFSSSAAPAGGGLGAGGPAEEPE